MEHPVVEHPLTAPSPWYRGFCMGFGRSGAVVALLERWPTAPMTATELVLSVRDPTPDPARLLRLAPVQTPALFRVAPEGTVCRVYRPNVPPGLFPVESCIPLASHAWEGYKPHPDFYNLGLAYRLGGGQ